MMNTRQTMIFSKILKIKNLPKPEPRSNEVIFRVISAALKL